MSLLRYFLIDSLTYDGIIAPNIEDLKRIKYIYWLLILQLGVYYIGSVLLFYFIIENWFFSTLIAVLFTFIYFSISMVLLSGLRLSSYIKVGLKKNENKSVLIGTTAIDVNEVVYDYSKNKNEIIPAVILRAFFIVVFGFFIFIGLILGISLYTKPNLDETHSAEIIRDYKEKNEKETQYKINLLSKKLEQYNIKRTTFKNDYKASIDRVKYAKDETHRMIFANDTAYFHKALLDWDFIHHNEMITIPVTLQNLQADYDNGYKKLELITAHKKFGIYRVNEFKKNNAFSFWILFIIVAALFLLPYYIRFKMILTNSPLDIALEEKIVSKIKKDYRLNQEELQNYHLMYDVEETTNDIIYEEAPFIKRKNDDGEIIALKNQMNVFLNNEI
jgi:hypothetical protein